MNTTKLPYDETDETLMQEMANEYHPEEVMKMKTEKEQFNYLNKLRDSGTTIMWDANLYLEEMFNLDEEEARNVLIAWMKDCQNQVRKEHSV